MLMKLNQLMLRLNRRNIRRWWVESVAVPIPLHQVRCGVPRRSSAVLLLLLTTAEFG